MTIKVSCNSCGASFGARDDLAGKRVACPKCKQPISIPAPASGGMDDLLDEIGLGAGTATGGRKCPSCKAPMAPTATVCVNCSYNVQLGRRLVAADANPAGSESDKAEEMLRKAERELKASPMQQSGDAYGEGGMSYLIAGGALVLTVIVVVVGILVVQAIGKEDPDALADGEKDQSTAKGMIIGGLVSAVAGWTWLLVMAFRQGVAEGLCVFFIRIYTLYFALARSSNKLASAMYVIGDVVCGIGLLMYDFGPDGNI